MASSEEGEIFESEKEGDLSDIFESESNPQPAAEPQVAVHEHELTEDELSDLTFAFQACDLDDAGTIAPDELHAMLSVLGANVDEAQCLALMKEAKQEFKEWLATHEVGTSLPEHMAHEKGKGHGVHGETKHGGQRHHAELSIDRKNRHHPVLSRMERVHANPVVKAMVSPVTYTGKLLSMSYGLAKKKVPDRTRSEINDAEDVVGEGGVIAMEENALHGLIETETEMIFAEYVHMMCGETIKKYTAADWHKAAYQMRLYRNAYDTADVDGDNKLEFEELEMVVMALDPHHSLSHEDMVYLWQVLNPNGLKSLSFTDFLLGMRDVKANDTCSTWIDINKPNKWEILSLIVDTPVGALEEKRILASLTGLERAGIQILAKHTLPMDRQRMAQVLKRAGDSRLRHLQQSQLDRMKQVHHRCVLLCGLVGFVWTILPAAAENWLCWGLEVDGVKDTYWVCRPHTVPADNPNSTTPFVPAWDPDSTFMQHPELFMCTYRIDNFSTCVYPEGYTGYVAGDLDWETSVPVQTRCSMCACSACQCIPVDDNGEPDHNVMVVWWTILVVVIVVNIVFEISLLMYIAVRYCVQVAWALDYRLIPLNADRAFLADSLVRAAFELGNPDSPVLGVDPHKETSSSSKLRIVFMLLMYKMKVVGTGLVVKAINKKLTPQWFSLFANPWLGTVGSTVFWDALIAHVIVHQAEIRGIGVYTSVELFNEIVDLHFNSAKDISPLGQIQIARAVGVAIVKQGSMYPTMELLLRHAIQYLGLRGKAVVASPGVLDNEDAFIMDLGGIDPDNPDVAGLTKEEQIVVLSVHLLALMLDGNIGRHEMGLWQAVVDSVDPGVAKFYEDRVTYLCTRFREFEPISAEIVHQCFDPDAPVEVPEIAKCQNCMFQFAEFLTC